jgi:hypothetical protein
MLAVPPDLGIITFTLNGKRIDFPNLDARGKLWIKQKTTGTTEADTLGIRVFRHIIDDIPFWVKTRMLLNISGKNREAVLEDALLEGFTALEIVSPLPASLEKDGKLRIKLRPGNWTIDIKSYRNNPVQSLKLTASSRQWPEEVWVFEARNHLRMVNIGGVPSIDSRQTDLPKEWKHLPAYYMKSGSEITFNEKKRGDSDPQPDVLKLSRDIWLDFDGEGYTIRDSITGRINKSSRLKVSAGVKLGRISINGMDQFITRLKNDDPAGVEVRKGDIKLTAESRLEKEKTNLNATGWSHDFKSLSCNLYLPPGWRVFLANGVDRVSHSWISRWTLFDLFLILFATVAMYKLMGTKAGVTAGITLVLVHTELVGLSWMILIILGTIALNRVLPEGHFKKSVKICRSITLLVLILTMVSFALVSFALHHMRNALHPQLQGFSYGGDYHRNYDKRFFDVKIGPHKEKLMELEEKPQAPMEGRAKIKAEKKDRMRSDIPFRKSRLAPKTAVSPKNYYLYDPNTAVQTGYGMSDWRGKRVYLNWNGPVSSDQTIEFWFMTPLLNLMLAFVRVVLLALLAGFLMEIKIPSLKDIFKKVSFALGIILAVTSFAANVSAKEDIPPDSTLSKLKQYVIKNLDEKPDCLPRCASISRMKLQVLRKKFTLRMEVHVDSDVTVPLPKVVSNNSINWRPEAVSVDGVSERVLLSSKNGYVWAMLKKGVRQVTVTGRLPDMDAVSISFLLVPYYSEYSADGWNLYGIQKNGETDSNIQLIRIKKAEKDDDDFKETELPPLLRVERTILFGTSWTVNTRVVRVSPQSSGILVNIPLLEGESVTTPGIRVKDKAAVVNMGAGTLQVMWESVLKKRADIFLKAPTSLTWTEVWRLNVTNLWHMTHKGIPKIHTDSSIPEWRPWPGEKLDVHLIKPKGIEGPTKTIDKVRLTFNAGQRILDAKLETKIRSSRGEQHNIKLPEGARLQEIKINNQSQPIQQNENNIPVFLTPGEQNITISWKQPKGVSNFFRVPEVDLGFQAVNIETILTLPRDRWPFFTGGPFIGPAVLFWGVFPVLLLLAVILGFTDITPLKIRHWFLLLIGLSQTDITVNFIVVGWLLVMGWRKKDPMAKSNNTIFDLRQVILGVWGIVAVISIFTAIEQGLLGSPDMKIIGNGSSTYYLKWFQDIAHKGLIRPWVISIHLIFYRISMLLWALWLAFAFTSWLKWAWTCFSEGGLWRSEKKDKA